MLPVRCRVTFKLKSVVRRQARWRVTRLSEDVIISQVRRPCYIVHLSNSLTFRDSPFVREMKPFFSRAAKCTDAEFGDRHPRWA